MLIELPVTKPELFTVIDPPLVVTIAPLRMKLLPLRTMSPDVVNVPAMLAVPVEEVRWREVAVKFWIVMLCDVVTVTAPKDVVDPAAFERRISPPPLARVIAPGPCKKLENVID